MDVNYHYTLRDLKIRLEIESLDVNPVLRESVADQSFVRIVIDEPSSVPVQLKEPEEVGP